MTARGFAAIALYRPKNDGNIGGAIRAAGVFGARLVVIGTERPNVEGRVERTDPRSTYRCLPVQWLPDVLAGVPHECVTVAVEIDPSAVPLPKFEHPERAYYIFGAEDVGLPESLRTACHHIVKIPAGLIDLRPHVEALSAARQPNGPNYLKLLSRIDAVIHQPQQGTTNGRT